MMARWRGKPFVQTSIAAGEFGEGGKRDAVFVLALRGAELGARWRRGEGLAVFPWLEEEIQFFSEAAVGAEEAQADGHGGDSEAIGDFLGGILQDVAEQADLAQI